MARAVLMSEQIKDGTFEYLKWFAEGNRADRFKPVMSVVSATGEKTIR
jgi:hypothetical protein